MSAAAAEAVTFSEAVGGIVVSRATEALGATALAAWDAIGSSDALDAGGTGDSDVDPEQAARRTNETDQRMERSFTSARAEGLLENAHGYARIVGTTDEGAGARFVGSRGRYARSGERPFRIGFTHVAVQAQRVGLGQFQVAAVNLDRFSEIWVVTQEAGGDIE